MSGWENPTLPASIVLAQTGAPAPGSHTGDLAEFLLAAAIVIPANTLGPNGFIVIKTLWSQIGAGATSPTLRARLGAPGSGLAGAVVASVVAGATSPQAGEQIWVISNNGNAVQVGASSSAQNVQTVNGNGSLLAAAIDTTQAAELNISGQLATIGNTITLKLLSVEVFPHQ